MDALNVLKEEHGVIGEAFLVWDRAVERLSKGKQLPPRFVAEFIDFLTIYVENYHYAREEALFKSLITLSPRLNPHGLDFDEWAKMHGDYGGVVHLLLDCHAEGHEFFARVQDEMQSLMDGQTISESLVSAINAHNTARLYDFTGEENSIFPEFEKRVLDYQLDPEEMTRSMNKIVVNFDSKVMEKIFRKYHYSIPRLLALSLEKKNFWSLP